MKKLLFIFAFASAVFTTAVANAQIARNTTEYNLQPSQMNLALKGYDPVSYFAEGGTVPKLGLAAQSLNYMGVVYQFANAQNLNLFMKNPSKYEPTYGGWCAYAMASGSKVDIQPLIYTISGNRLHFFVSKRAKQNFDSNVSEYEANADKFWKQISGEEPRL